MSTMTANVPCSQTAITKLIKTKAGTEEKNGIKIMSNKATQRERDAVYVCMYVLMMILNIETNPRANEGCANTKDQMHIIGVIAKLYMNNIENMANNSLGVLK